MTLYGCHGDVTVHNISNWLGMVCSGCCLNRIQSIQFVYKLVILSPKHLFTDIVQIIPRNHTEPFASSFFAIISVPYFLACVISRLMGCRFSYGLNDSSFVHEHSDLAQVVFQALISPKLVLRLRARLSSAIGSE